MAGAAPVAGDRGAGGGRLGLARGWRRSGRTTLLALAGTLLLFHIHAGWALAFQTGDVPKDMLIYVQTSPDVTRVMKELDEFSELTTGGKDLPIMYDDNTSWRSSGICGTTRTISILGCTSGGAARSPIRRPMISRSSWSATRTWRRTRN